jgi:hypothetical protein
MTTMRRSAVRGMTLVRANYGRQGGRVGTVRRMIVGVTRRMIMGTVRVLTVLMSAVLRPMSVHHGPPVQGVRLRDDQ